MNELSLYILDLVQNSVTAGAAHVEILITISDADDCLEIILTDDGCGMSEEFVKKVVSPFTTTRTTRKVGMGLPLYRMAAEQTGGSFSIESTEGVGTTVTAAFRLDHLDCAPLGDLAGTMAMLIQGSPDIDFTLVRSTPAGNYIFKTQELREYLGDEIPLDTPEIFLWLNSYLEELEQSV